MNVARCASPALRHWRRRFAGACSEMSVPNPVRRRQLRQQRQQDRAGAGAEIGDAQRAIEAPSARSNSSASSTTVSVSGRGTSVAGESCERQSPEFLLAENARDRLAGEAAAREVFEACRFVRRELPLRRRDQAGEVEAERVADQQPAHRVRREFESRRASICRESACASAALRCARHRRRWLISAQTRYGSLRRRDDVALTPPRLGRRVARPDARSSARRSVHPALRPRSPAAICRASG